MLASRQNVELFLNDYLDFQMHAICGSATVQKSSQAVDDGARGSEIAKPPLAPA